MDSREFGSANEAPEELASRLELPFKDVLLLSRALTHRSYLNEHPEALEDNERLEFLGDAVLDFLVAAWLYNRFPEMLEGDLTRMRSALVHTERLADYALKIDLGKAMRLGKGETLSGGHRRLPLLCDTFEAVVGALYLDSGIESVLKFMTPLLDEASDEILAKNQLDDPKSALQEWAQAQGIPTPQYLIKNSSGPEHSKVFEVEVMINGEIIGSGTGRSKQTAAKEAAQQAINQLGIES
jgi:ribonuclease III